MQHHLKLLGHEVRDVVTGRTGVIVSVSFDLSGCIQGYIQPAAGKDGKVSDGIWCDTKRLKALKSKPVQLVPEFDDVSGGSDLPGHPTMAAPR